jgi:hypothetical protein
MDCNPMTSLLAGTIGHENSTEGHTPALFDPERLY